ncbi:MAG: CaiB/BaiF CoA-transferase family protein [Ideonella sp.]
MSGKLDGIRVIDMSRVLAGPLAGQMLADLGAEVIKIEQPGSGDEARRYGPPFHGDQGAGETSFFLAANRNKLSVTIDFASLTGQRLLTDLVQGADVLIENFRVGTLARHGLDYETLCAINPGLVYCSLTGFGQTGPYAQRPGYDAIFQSMGGLMSSIGYPDDHPFGGPMRTGLSITDVITSLYADIAIVAALHGRAANGGKGEHIDIALLDSTVAAMSHYAMYYLISGQVPPRRGNAGNGGVPSQLFRCLDGALVLTVGNDAQFARLCGVLGCADLATDTRFASGIERIRHRDTLLPMLESMFADRTVTHWLTALEKADIPSGAINDMAQVFADPQVAARGLRQTGTNGAPDSVANPIRFRHQPVDRHEPAPALGAHTDEVLGRCLGLSRADLDSLRAQSVI